MPAAQSYRCLLSNAESLYKICIFGYSMGLLMLKNRAVEQGLWENKYHQLKLRTLSIEKLKRAEALVNQNTPNRM